MEKVTIGTKVKPLGIQRLSVGEGQKCRAVLIDPNPCMKYIAYDNAHKCRVEVDQDMVIKYGLSASATFYYLVAKLNTDLNGRIIGDNFTVEYLQLSETLNNRLSDQITEQGIPASFSMNKVKKLGDGGKDFSHIEVTPSAVKPEGSLLQKIEELRANKEFIDKCWAMIDATTSISKEKYEKILAEEANPQGLPPASEYTQHSLPSGGQSPVNSPSSPMPQAPADFNAQNDFGAGDDFNFE